MRRQAMALLILLGVVSLSLADFDLKPGETGKYRWWLESHQRYMVCCYCPKKAVEYDEYIDVFQRDECGTNATNETDKFGNDLYPYCACEPKKKLVPQFIGCKLPKLKNVTWDCDNGFLFPNVSVYTICEPSCTEDRMILSKTGTDSYRCNEEKKWENNPLSVSCKFKHFETSNNNTLNPILIALSPAIPGFFIFVMIVICWRRKWYLTCLTVKDKCSSSPENSKESDSGHIALSVFSDNTQSTDVTEIDSEMSSQLCPQNSTNSIQSESSPGNNSAYKEEVNQASMERASSYFARTKADVKQDEMIPFLTETLATNCEKQIVKVSGIPMTLKDNKIYYNVMLGNQVVVATSVTIESPSDFSFDRECVTRCNNFCFKIEKVKKEDEGIYNWSVKGKGSKEVKKGQFTLNVLDQGRQDPVGGESSLSLSCNDLNTESIITIEEEVLEGGGPGTCPFQNEAVVCQRQSHFLSESLQGQGNAPLHLPGQQNSTGDFSAQNKDIDLSAKKNCEKCNKTISEALKDYSASEHLANICEMLDPLQRNENMCWIGFLKFYREELKMKNYNIDNIKYHKKGDPDDGHMKYILTSRLPQNGFRVGHLVLYFSRKQSRRIDVLLEIQKFHSDCQFCNDYLNTKCILKR